MNILKKDKRLWDENNLIKPLLFELLENYDKELFELLLTDKDIKAKFFVQAGESYVFKYEDFRFAIEQDNLDGSYTKYANTIGLSNKGKFLSESTDYVLNWPYKDTILEGGMSSEEDMDTFIKKIEKTTPGKMDKKTGSVISLEKTEVSFKEHSRKREEIFYNNIIADKEIDRLLDKKALKNFTRYTAKGEEKVKEIKRNEDGTIKENLLVKGNNLLAMYSLKEQFAGKVKLVYIDPPYNTPGEANTFSYNNRFNHSTWLTFMKNRLEISQQLLKEDGICCLAIDDNEFAELKLLADDIFGKENFIGTVVVQIKKEGRTDNTFFATSHDYALFYAKNIAKAKIFNIPINSDELNEKYKNFDSVGNYNWRDFIRTGGNSTPKERPNQYFPFIFEDDNLIGIGGKNISKKIGDYATDKIYILDEDGYAVAKEVDWKSLEKYNLVFPINSSGGKQTWRWSDREKILYAFQLEEICLINKKIKIKDRIKEGSKPTTTWYDPEFNATTHGTLLLKKMFDGKKVFSYPKSLYTLSKILNVVIGELENEIVLDFFAGSGTTAHAASYNNQNVQFIMIEQMDYIETATKKRLIKSLGVNSNINDFIYFELAEYNEEAKNKIDACKSYKELKKLFTELTDYYFLNYNVSVKQFNNKTLDDKDFQELPLEEQKKLFKALLDNNQLYISYDEQDDPRFKLSKEDRKLTEIFYE